MSGRQGLHITLPGPTLGPTLTTQQVTFRVHSSVPTSSLTYSDAPGLKKGVLKSYHNKLKGAHVA